MAIELYNQSWNNIRGVIQKGVDGNSHFLPNPLKRLQSTFNIVPGRFTLLGSTSGGGKSAFIDDLYIMKTFLNLKKYQPDATYEVLYYAMERNIESKHLKWLSWMVHYKTGWIVAPEDLAGRNVEGPPNEKLLKVIDELKDTFVELTDRVDIYDSRISAELIRKHVIAKARKLGRLFKADSTGVTIDDNLAYIATFSEKKKKLLSDGSEVMYVDLEYKGEKFILFPDKHKYFPHNPKTYMFIILDGVGIIDASDFSSTKAAVDNVTNLLADARDVYSFNPVMVSQFNRGIADSQRAKMHGAALAPQESDFKDSSNMYQAADLAIGLFDPFKFKAYNKEGLYGGYDIINGMMSPFGHNRFRSAHVLKNTYGKDGGIFGMKFLGEMGRFEALPIADSLEIHEVYATIASGK